MGHNTVGLPVSHEITISELTPPSSQLFFFAGQDGSGSYRQRLFYKCSWRVYHTSKPSANQTIATPMLQSGHCFGNRGKTTRTKYQQAARMLGATFVPWFLKPIGILALLSTPFLTNNPRNTFEMQPTQTMKPNTILKQSSEYFWLQRANASLLLSKISRTQQSLQLNAQKATVDFSGASGWSFWALNYPQNKTP